MRRAAYSSMRQEIGTMEKERARTWIRDVAAAVAAAARCFPETH